MRIGSASALVLAAFALAACEGSPTTGSSASNASLDLCGLNCPDPVIAGNPTPPAPPVDPNAPPNTNIGNKTKLTTGDTTIALESAVLKSPANGSLSKLTITSGTPNSAVIRIDTKTSNNKNWPIAKPLQEYVSGSGLGASYKEYRSVDANVDEELQVWTWGQSYGTQYREVGGGGGEARRQAWSFGGTRTPAMQTSGIASYTGRYGATSQTWNWVDDTDPGKTVTANNSWRVEGTSSLSADFGTLQFTGTLTPSTWTARRTTDRQFQAVGATSILDPNWVSFMDDDVVLNGQITGNTIKGAARLDPAEGWVNGTNPMYAGFFGPVGPAQEVTGVYNFLAVGPDPIGGEPPINDDARGYVQQSGVFNGQ